MDGQTTTLLSSPILQLDLRLAIIINPNSH